MVSAFCVHKIQVPGTALTSLLRNGTFGKFTRSDDTSSTSGSGTSSSNDIVDRVYIDDNLASVPDINATGCDFYTFWYRTEVRRLALRLRLYTCSCGCIRNLIYCSFFMYLLAFLLRSIWIMRRGAIAFRTILTMRTREADTMGIVARK